MDERGRNLMCVRTLPSLLFYLTRVAQYGHCALLLRIIFHIFQLWIHIYYHSATTIDSSVYDNKDSISVYFYYDELHFAYENDLSCARSRCDQSILYRQVSKQEILIKNFEINKMSNPVKAVNPGRSIFRKIT